MKVTVGTAPDSWGVWFPEDPRQMPWQRFLDEVKEAGYEWIELGPYGYLPTDLALLRSEVDKRGLKVSGAFVIGDFANPAVAWPKIEHELRALGPLLRGLRHLFVLPKANRVFSALSPCRSRANRHACAWRSAGACRKAPGTCPARRCRSRCS